MQIRRLLSLAAFAGAFGFGQAAGALTLQVAKGQGSLVGEAFAFQATATDASGEVQYSWDFGDGTETDYDPAASQISHTYQKPGIYHARVVGKDAGGGQVAEGFIHTVHYPFPAVPPSASGSIVFSAARGRVYSVNQDNDSVTAIDAETMMRLGELPVYRRPEALAVAPNGKLWVVHRDDYAVAIIDLETFAIERGFRLPYASQPMGIAFGPTGDAAYISLMGSGQLLKLNPMTGDIVGKVDVGPMPRGVAVSSDGKTVYVTRFISPNTGGEVVQIDAAAMMVSKRISLAPDTTTPDSDQGGRGLPNYLFSVTISPDGREAYLPCKKDNIFRGTFLEDATKALNKDNTVRPMVSVLDLTQGTEAVDLRMDLDDRSLPIHATFSPFGEYAFVTLSGTNMVEIRETSTGKAVASINDASASPRGSVLGPHNRLFVQAALGRVVNVFDLDPLLSDADTGTPVKLADIVTVEHDTTDQKVLLGKRIFNSAADPRMTPEGYLTCAVCHFDGFEDGRVFDFTSRGEGLRNTTSLLGRRGAGQGPVHWSGNFDEIQDFELEIRELFAGRGFMTDEALKVGTRAQPLGDAKKGVSPELDALAAYVDSLDHVNPSPFKNQDGTLTESGVAGKALFGKLGCDFCHSGSDDTDSARKRLHDVGTLLPSSGSRSGGPLLGIDTPTLLGIWETAPYLHDGSAPTLRDVLVTKNPNDQHGFVSSLMPQQVDQLVSYLQQIDGDPPPHRLPFEPALPDTAGAGGGGSSAGGVGGAAGQAQGATGGVAGTPPVTAPPKTSSCAWSAAGPADATWPGLVALGGLIAALFVRKRRSVS